MRSFLFSHLVLASFVLLTAHTAASQNGCTSAEGWQSRLVHYLNCDPSTDSLVYKVVRGERIPDFSHAGYRGGGVPLPTVPVVATLQPVPGDNTGRIQAVLDSVGGLNPNLDGFRGAVLLEAGIYEVTNSLAIERNGVVLRGVGSGANPDSNTVLLRTGTNSSAVVKVGVGVLVGSPADRNKIATRDLGRDTTHITDDLVPTGAYSFNVARPELYTPGEDIVVFHPSTPEWIAAVDSGGTAGAPPWEPGEWPVAYARTITDTVGTSITVDAPFFYTFDTAISLAYIYLRDNADTVERVGVEDIRIDIVTEDSTAENHAWDGVYFSDVRNVWAKNVTALHFVRSGIALQSALHVTVLNCQALYPHSLEESRRRYSFSTHYTQLSLFQNNRTIRGRPSYIVNGTSYDSGIVFLDNTAEQSNGNSQAHQRWSTGVLFDNHYEENLLLDGSGNPTRYERRLHLGNRGSGGSGHGWACANCIAWNASMEDPSVLVVEKPPTAQNLAIGGSGNISGTAGPFYDPPSVSLPPNVTAGYIEGANRPGLLPRSLYLAQLCDRLETPEACAAVRDT